MAIAAKLDGSAVLPSPGASLQQPKATARSKGTKARRKNKEEEDPTQGLPPPSTTSTTTPTARVALQVSTLSAAEQAKAAAISYLWPQSKAPSYNVTDYWARWRPSPNHAAIVASSSDVFEVRRIPRAKWGSVMQGHP